MPRKASASLSAAVNSVDYKRRQNGGNGEGGLDIMGEFVG